MLRGRAGTFGFGLASLAVLAACWRPALPEGTFVVPPQPSLVSPAARVCQSQLLPRVVGIKDVHSASLARLPNGELLCVWFGGSKEGAPDVVLFQSHFRNGRWDEPKILISPQAAGEAEGQYIRRVGNTSLYRDSRGRIHLFFVSASFGGWACSSINHMISTDGGVTWSKPRRVLTTPFFNLSTLVRHSPIGLADGGFLLPAYFELTNKFPELLRFDADGSFLGKVRMDGQHGSLQPCLVPLDDKHAFAFLRNRCLEPEQLLLQKTDDGGLMWTKPAPLLLPNFDTPVAAVRLSDGSFLIAYNPTHKREVIRLATSPDGVNWTDRLALDGDGPQPADGVDMYCYPTMLVDGDTVDLVYTYRRLTIRHYRFNTAWVKSL